MSNVPVPPAQMHDPQGKANPEHSRDPIRTPMQWNSGPNAGFAPANVAPWLPLASDYQIYNVASEQNDPRSLLSLTRALLALRRSLPALTLGSYRSLDQGNAACFAYLREHEEQRYRRPQLLRPGAARKLVGTGSWSHCPLDAYGPRGNSRSLLAYFARK